MNNNYLEVSSNIECYSSCGMNHIENGEVETKCQYPRAENDGEGWNKGLMGVKPFKNSITFK